MSTLVAPAPQPEAKEPPPPPPEPRSLPRWAWALIVIAVWVVVWFFTQGIDTLAIGAREHTEIQNRFTHYFVDEFQDTDPLQAEILLLLSADHPETSDWRQARPIAHPSDRPADAQLAPAARLIAVLLLDHAPTP